jgi:hypothetical protein
LVEAASLEHHGRSRTDQPTQFQLPAFRALPFGISLDALEKIKLMSAGVAQVFVGWHGLANLLRFL